MLARDRLVLLLAAALVVLAALWPGEVACSLAKQGTLDVILFFASLVVASRALEFSGLLSRAASALALGLRRPSARIVVLAYMAAAASAVMMNDASLFVFVPLARMTARYGGIDAGLAVVSVIMAANIGSSLTPIGNPQNLYVWRVYGVPAHVFVASLAPLVALGMAALTMLVLAESRDGSSAPPPVPPVRIDASMAILSVCMVALVIMGGELGYVIPASASVIILYLIALRRRFRPNLSIIALFTLMIVDFQAASRIIASRFPEAYLGGGTEVFLAALLLSQAMSNVPATILLSGLTDLWRPLIVGADLGGIGFLPGSLANIIGVRLGEISVYTYHRYALPLFALLIATICALSLAGIYP